MAKLLKVGIQENVTLSTESGLNKDGKPIIVMQVKPTQDDVLDAMMEGRVLEGAKSGLLQFYPNMTYYNSEEFKSATDLTSEFAKETLKISTYVALITTPENAVAKFNPTAVFQALGIQGREGFLNAMSQMNDEVFLKSVYDKLYSMFHDFLGTIQDLEKFKFRHKFVRGSKKKTFAAIPPINEGNPYVELMTVPLASSKISWSVYELENGKNSAEEVAADESEDVDNASEMFDAPIAAPMQPDLLDAAPVMDAPGLMSGPDDPGTAVEEVTFDAPTTTV